MHAMIICTCRFPPPSMHGIPSFLHSVFRLESYRNVHKMKQELEDKIRKVAELCEKELKNTLLEGVTDEDIFCYTPFCEPLQTCIHVMYILAHVLNS